MRNLFFRNTPHFFDFREDESIIIPDKKHNADSGGLGEIIQGYCKPSILTRTVFARRIYRPKYYRYFDSFMRPYRPELPETYTMYLNDYGLKLLNRLKKKKHHRSFKSFLRHINSRLRRL